MGTIRVQVVLNRKSGIARDAVVNTFHFRHASGLGMAAEFDKIRDAIRTLYGTLDQYLGDSLSAVANAHQIKMYNVLGGDTTGADLNTGPPDRVDTMTLAPSDAGYLPAEVALAVSFRAVDNASEQGAGGTRPASRRRGRVFLGPLSGPECFGVRDVVTQEVAVHPDARAAILGAFTTFHGALAGGGTPIAHAVYSRVDGIARPVEEYSVDDAPDVVRSRGVRAAVRTRAAVTAPVLAA